MAASLRQNKRTITRGTQTQWERFCQEDNATGLQAALLKEGLTAETCHLHFHWCYDKEYALGRLLLFACHASAMWCSELLLNLTESHMMVNHVYFDVDSDETMTLCHVASRLGESALLKLYIEAGASVCILLGVAGVLPIHVAAANGHVECVRVLAGLPGFDIDCRAEYQETALHLAAQFGHLECVQVLLHLGATVGSRDESSRRAVHFAAGEGHVECIRALAENFADLECCDEYGRRPVHFAAEEGHAECVRALLDLGAYADYEDESGIYPIHLAAREGHVDCIQVLVDNDTDVNQTTANHRTPIHYTAEAGDVECVCALVAIGADIHQGDGDGVLPIHLAAAEGHIECVRALVRLGTSLDSQSDNGRTPVHHAVQGGHVECVKALVDMGAGISREDTDGHAAIHMSAATGNLDCLKALVELGAKVTDVSKNGMTSMHYAAGNGHMECIRELARLGCRINHKNNDGHTPLSLACQNKQWPSAFLLVEANADIVAAGPNVTTDFLIYAMEQFSVPFVAAQLKSAFKASMLASADGLELTSVNLAEIRENVLESRQPGFQDVIFVLSVEARMRGVGSSPALVVRFLGPPGSGKTTLIKSLFGETSWWQRLQLRFGFWTDLKDTIPSGRTKGIRRHHHRGVIYVDVGGQYEYASTHQRLLAPGGLPVLDLMLICSSDGTCKVRSDMRQWANFTACRKRSNEKSNVIVIGTRADYATNEQEAVVEEEQKFLARGMGKRMEFLEPEVAFVDARDVTSVDVIRNIILFWRDIYWPQVKGIRKPRDVIGAFLDDVLRALESTLIVSVEEFASRLFVEITGLDADFVSGHIEYIEEMLGGSLEDELARLNQECLLFYFKDCRKVVTDPTWLMNKVTGKLFSPEHFPAPHITTDKDGFAERSNVVYVLGHDSKVSGEVALEVAVKLGLCLLTPDERHVLVLPARQDRRSERHWPPPSTDEHKAYTGCRLHCQSGVAISAALVPTLQIALLKKYGGHDAERFPLWKYGIRVDSGDCQCLLEAVESQLAINIITRGKLPADVQSFHHKIVKLVEKAASSLSPGSELESVFIAEDMMSRDRLLLLDKKGECGAGMAFLASKRVRDVFRYLDASDPVNTSLPPLREDPRMSHDYVDGTQAHNEESFEGRQKASRYCSAMFQHRALVQRVLMDKLERCVSKLVDLGQVNVRAMDDVMGPKQGAAADVLRMNICDLPDSVVIAFVDQVLPRVLGCGALYRTLTTCEGHIKCRLHSNQAHDASAVNSSDSGRIECQDPWRDRRFEADFYEWFLKLDPRKLRTSSVKIGMIRIDDEQQLKCIARPGHHNDDLLELVLPHKRESFEKFLDVVTDLGMPEKRKRLEELLWLS